MKRDAVARSCPSHEGSLAELPHISVTDIDKRYSNSDWRSRRQLAKSTSVRRVGNLLSDLGKCVAVLSYFQECNTNVKRRLKLLNFWAFISVWPCRWGACDNTLQLTAQILFVCHKSHELQIYFFHFKVSHLSLETRNEGFPLCNTCHYDTVRKWIGLTSRNWFIPKACLAVCAVQMQAWVLYRFLVSKMRFDVLRNCQL